MANKLLPIAIFYIITYLIIIATKLILSGFLILFNPLNWYAIITPLFYVVIVILDIKKSITLSKKQIIILHILVFPTIIFSFLGYGFLLFIITLMWWQSKLKANS